MIIALAKVLDKGIQFLLDEEMDDLCESELQNLGFLRVVCAIDGTEIQISHPKNSKIQTNTWSRKKKQNSLNVMTLTKLNGKIIFQSTLQVKAHDQSHMSLSL